MSRVFNLVYFLYFYISKSSLLLTNLIVARLVVYFNFIQGYFIRINLIWNEGLLIDFLQKKSFDIWALKFLVISSYLFNERIVYDIWVRFFLDYIIWPSNKILFFETFNLVWVFFLLVFTFLFLIILLLLISLFLVTFV